jgi:small-conductance mechanosensitive channel
VKTALREAGIEIAVPQRIIHLEQNDAAKHSLVRHRTDAGGNLPSGGAESVAKAGKPNPSSGGRPHTHAS